MNSAWRQQTRVFISFHVFAAQCDKVAGFASNQLDTNNYNIHGTLPNCSNSQGHLQLSIILNRGTGSVNDGLPQVSITTHAVNPSSTTTC